MRWLGKLAALALLLLCAWSFNGGTSLVVPAADFRDILEEDPGKTVAAYKDRPLSRLSPANRSSFIKGILRESYPDWYGEETEDPPGDGGSSCGYDWLSGHCRVACRISQLRWEASKHWALHFQNLKSGVKFDRLLLACYAPTAIYIYEHREPSDVGNRLAFYGKRGAEQWSAALQQIFGKMEAAGCRRLAEIALGDWRVQSLAASLSSRNAEVYEGTPLSELNGQRRARRLEKVLRRLDARLHPDAAIADAVAERPDGVPCEAAYSWLRDDRRIACKSSSLVWSKQRQHWQVDFKEAAVHGLYDELLLALYLPDGLHVYQHDGKYGVGKSHVTLVAAEHDPAEAASSILERLKRSPCCHVATVQWQETAPDT